jgi:hypothetical protein
MLLRWRQFSSSSIDQVVSTGFEGTLEAFSAHLAASMRGVSPEVVWNPRLFSVGSVGPDMLCWRPVCVGNHLGGLHSRSAVCSYVWHITEEPITHDSILASSMT